MRRASLLLLLFAFLAEGAEAEKGGVGRDAREIGPAPRLNEEAKPAENAGPMMVEEFLKKHGLTVPRDESGAVPDPTDLPSGITIPLPPLPPMPESLKRESEEEEEEEDEAPAVVPSLPALPAPAATIAPAPVLPLVETSAQEDEVPKIETLEAVAPKREIALPLGPSSGITIAPPPGVFEEEPAKKPASIIGDDPFHRQIPLPDVPDGAGAGGEEAGPKEEFDNNPIAEDGSLKRPWSRFLNSRFVITVPPPPPERQQTIGIPDELLNPTTTTTTTTRRTTTTPLTTTTTTEATTTTTTTTTTPPPPPAPLPVLPVETPIDTSGTTPIPIPSIEELRRASVAPFVIELLQGEPSANDLVFIRQIIAQNRHLRPTTTTLPPPPPPPPAPVPVVVPEVKAEVPVVVETKEEPQVPQTLAQEVTTTTATPAAPDFAAPAKTGNFDSLVTDFLKKKSETGAGGQIEKHSEFVSSRKKPRRKNRKHRHRKTHRTGLRKSGNFRRHRKTVSGDTVQHKKRRSERRHRQSAAAVVPEVALPSMSEILLAEPQLDAPPEFAAAPPVDADMPDITIDRQRQARRQRREVDRR